MSQQPHTHQTFAQLLERLAKIGLSAAAVRGMMPDWWDEVCEQDVTLMPHVEMIIARALGLPYSVVHDPAALLIRAPTHTPQAAPGIELPPDLAKEHIFGCSASQTYHIEAWQVLPPGGSAGLCAWLVRHPRAHAFWCWWLVSVVHLRVDAALPAPRMAQEGQTHELGIIPLDPQSEVHPAHPGKMRFLNPDHMIPLVRVTDDQARALCERAVTLIVAGNSPDSDFRGAWRAWAEQAVAEARGQ